MGPVVAAAERVHSKNLHTTWQWSCRHPSVLDGGETDAGSSGEAGHEDGRGAVLGDVCRGLHEVADSIIKVLERVRLVEDAILKIVGVNSPRRFNSCLLRWQVINDKPAP